MHSACWGPLVSPAMMDRQFLLLTSPRFPACLLNAFCVGTGEGCAAREPAAGRCRPCKAPPVQAHSGQDAAQRLEHGSHRHNAAGGQGAACGQASHGRGAVLLRAALRGQGHALGLGPCRWDAPHPGLRDVRPPPLQLHCLPCWRSLRTVLARPGNLVLAGSAELGCCLEQVHARLSCSVHTSTRYLPVCVGAFSLSSQLCKPMFCF